MKINKSESLQTFFRWHKDYGNLNTDQAKCLRELESENQRLKRLQLTSVRLSALDFCVNYCLSMIDRVVI
jgi:hypothetical protein